LKLFLFLFLVSSLWATKPQLLLLNNYSEDINVTNWYMSEKLDGVRAYWDGKNLISRSGKIFNPPAFFIKDFPSHKLDGELWIQRGGFSKIVSIINQKKSNQMWKNITYNIFEVPDSNGILLQRVSKVKENKYIKVIQQIKIKSKKHLKQFLKTIEEKGGEGVVVRDGTLTYYTGRTNNALKVKSYIDEECELIGYNKGKGKYNGITGSLICKTKDSQIVNIGSGLSDKLRTRPPKIGSIITFKYYGLTSKGKPRFPVFLRVRR